MHTYLTARFPVYDSAGTIYGIGGILTDITERKRTEEALRQERRRLAALESISETGLSTLDLRKLLDALVEQIASALDADSSCLFVLDEQAREMIAYAAHNVPGLIGYRVKITEGFIGEVMKRRQPVCLTDAQRYPELLDRYSERAKTLLGAPLIARGRVVGVTRVQTFEERTFAEDEIRLLQAMADRAALAIDNAELFEDLQRSRSEVEAALDREKHYSLLLQRALLPSMPEIGSGYDVAAEYVPVPFSGEIGGDFYDVFRVGEHRAGILIGDVSGKGLEAAAMAATTRSTIHAFVHETASAAEALARANSVLYSRQIEFESFATVFLVIIDTSTGEISYSSAGHPPPVMCRYDGTFDYLRFGQMPLAAIDSQDFQEHKERFGPGDKLLMYTDGISEARRGSQLFDVEGIERVVSRCCELSARDLARDLLDEATDWAQGRLRDDAAVVVVARGV
jgi:serine phosphatase RsbU (regulator of sigma subunit)